MLTNLYIRNVFSNFARSVRSFAALFTTSFLVVGCTSGMGNILITPPSYQIHLTEQKGTYRLPTTIHIKPVKDVRSDIVGGLVGGKNNDR